MELDGFNIDERALAEAEKRREQKLAATGLLRCGYQYTPISALYSIINLVE